MFLAGRYAMERTNRSISVWFWPRDSPNVPSDVRSGTSATVSTGGWGTPLAAFVDDTCSISSHFGAHNIIINLTFCEYYFFVVPFRTQEINSC